MAVEIKLPELGENITSGTLARLLVKEGDHIKKDQPLIELETDKAVVEVPSSHSGVVTRIAVKEGESINVGQTILLLEAAGSPAPKPIQPEAAGSKMELKTEKTAAEPKISQEKTVSPAISDAKVSWMFTLPELGENVLTGTVSKILVSTGEAVSKGQSVLELETEKAVIEIPVDFPGTIKKILINEGEVIKIGQNILEILTSAEAGIPSKIAAEISSKPELPPFEPTSMVTGKKEEELGGMQTVKPELMSRRPDEPAPAAPAVRRFAREIGVDVQQVAGSGSGGRISIEDVKNYARSAGSQQAVSREILKGVETEELPDFTRWGEVERQPMSKVREKTARHLSYAWATIPHVTQFDKADITDLEQLRQRFSKPVEAAGGKLTITVILLKIIAVALKRFPQFNASVDMDRYEIIYKKYINIGVAADTDRGLLVPVIKQVDSKNLTQLSSELTELAQKARDRKLTLEEMQGGNFSISNLGGIGGTGFSPVVNSPEVAILGVSRSEMQQVYKDGEYRSRLMLPLSLSYDHRLIDGADAARFLRWVAESMEQPFRILLEL